MSKLPVATAIKRLLRTVNRTSSQVFVSNHDLEREDKALRWNAKGSQYWLAHVFLLTWPYGRPDVLSAFDYKKFDDGPRKGRVECGR